MSRWQNDRELVDWCWWQTVQVSCTRNSCENLGTRTFPCVISSRASFFSYEKLGWIRTMFYSVRETWSHVIEMLRHYWVEVRFVFFTIFRCWLLLVVSYFFRLFGHFVDYGLLYGKNKIWNSLSSLSSAVFLVRDTWMVLCATCIQVSCTKFLARVSRTRNLDRLPSALVRGCYVFSSF